MKPERAWFLAGYAHLGAAAFVGLLTAASGISIDPNAHIMLALSALVLIAGALTHGFIAPFLKREPTTYVIAFASLAAIAAADIALVAAQFGAFSRWVAPLYGGAFVLLPTHVTFTAMTGNEWRGGIALYASDQPFRRGDMFSATAFATAFTWLTVSGFLVAAPTRATFSAPYAALLLGFALPFFTGVLTFLLPRNAKTPLPGITLHATALGALTLATAAIVIGFYRPFAASFLHPAVAVSLALGLSLTAFLRLRFPDKPGPQIRRATPVIRALVATTVLAMLITPIAFYAFPDLSLLAIALYTTLTLATLAALATTILGAPILLNAIPREGRWTAWASATAILGLFLLAPAFQYPRGTGPGAIALATAIGIMLWGLWPLRKPRREC